MEIKLKALKFDAGEKLVAFAHVWRSFSFPVLHPRPK